jgi:Asp-tRNA(Asn)/Glu-tRNA(Gln) amidotransferase A subunit family amidase
VENYVAAKEYVERARREIAARVAEVDVVLTSPTFNSAPVGLHSTGNAGLIIPWTCAGSPLTVLPTGLDRDGVPQAVMLAGHAGDDLRHARISLRVGELLASSGRCIDGADLAPLKS